MMNRTTEPALIIATLLGGDGPTGVETHLHHIREEAAQRGHTVYLVTPYTGSRLARALYRPLKHAPIEWMRILYRISQAGALRRQIRSLLRRHPDGQVTIYAQCPLSARAALAARADCNAEAIVVAAVHYNISEADEVVARGWARPNGPWSKHLMRLERYTLPQVDRVGFVSDFMRRLVNARVPALTRVRQETLFNFTDDPGAVSPAALSDTDLIAIGTLEARKNQAFLLHVLAECRNLGKAYTLSVVGDGPDRAALEALARTLHIAGQVRFLGFQRKASALIARHKVLVHAATSENCPVIIAEALASGRPILAPAIGGIPEMFHDGVEGHYWNLDQPAQAAELLSALLEDNSAYAQTAIAARQRYDSVFFGLRSQWIQFLLPAAAAA